jgi:hypothetical protein
LNFIIKILKGDKMTGLLNIFKIVAAIGTILTGLISLVRPESVFAFTGLRVEGGRGITEIRSILGAFFVGLGVMALYYRTPQTYGMLGFTYLFVGLVRLVSMFLDRSVEQSNIISVVVEMLFGIILVL